MASAPAVALLIVWVIMLLVGIGPGYPGIRQTLLEGGVGSDVCGEGDFPCEEQAHLLDKYNGASLTLMSMLLLPVGIFIDVVGSLEVAWIGILLWTIAQALKGVAPGSGVTYFLTETATGVFGTCVFLPLLFVYTRGVVLCGKENRIVALANGVWNAAAVTYVILGYLRKHTWLQKAPLWLFFAGYSLIAGVPSLFAVTRIFPPRWVSPPLSLEHTERRRVLEVLRENVAAFRQAAGDLLFWAWILALTPAVGYGYFFISHVYFHMEFVGATEQEAKYYNSIFSVILPTGAVFSLVPGELLRQGAMLRGVLIIVVMQVSAAAGLWALALFGKAPHLSLQYGAFTLFVFYRINTFTFQSCIAPLLYPANILGTCFSFPITIAGIISTLLQPYLSSCIKDDLDSWRTIHTVFFVFIVAGWGAFGLTAWYSLDARTGQSIAVRSYRAGNTMGTTPLQCEAAGSS